MIIRIFAILLFLFIPLLGFNQPGQGGDIPGQGGGPGGGGGGNDPCARANPPPSCSSVPIDDDIWVLIIGGSLIGGLFVLRNKKLVPEDKPI